MVPDRRSDPIEIGALEQQLATADDGDVAALMQAVATYEAGLSSAHEQGESDRYQGITRAYRERLIAVLDDAVLAEDWELLEEFLDAYHPDTSDEFPHVTTVLQNVTGRYLIRTRLTEGVTEIPVKSLEFFSSILDRVEGDGYDFINEGVHPYGWGIGHPDHAVADTIHQHASKDIFIVNPMLEHAFYADQHAAIDLLERIVNDDNISRSFAHPRGEISETRHLLDAPAGAVSEFSPTIPRYWEWQEEFDFEFRLDDDVEQRIRKLVSNEGLDNELSGDWEIADLTL
jgi:hypothetical protein